MQIPQEFGDTKALNRFNPENHYYRGLSSHHAKVGITHE